MQTVSEDTILAGLSGAPRWPRSLLWSLSVNLALQDPAGMAHPVGELTTTRSPFPRMDHREITKNDFAPFTFH